MKMNGCLCVTVLYENDKQHHRYLSDSLSNNVDMCIDMIKAGKYPPTDICVLFNVIEKESTSERDILRLMERLDKKSLSCECSLVSGLPIAHTIIRSKHILDKYILIKYLIKECHMSPNIERKAYTTGPSSYHGKILSHKLKRRSAHVNGYSLLEWAIWYNDISIVKYLLQQSEIDPEQVIFIEKDGSYMLTGLGLPSKETLVDSGIYHLVEEAKKIKSIERIKKDMYNIVFYGMSLDIIYYSDEKKLGQLAEMYFDTISQLFKGFNGMHFELSKHEDVLSARNAELTTVCMKYQKLANKVYRADLCRNVVIQYSNIYPLLDIDINFTLDGKPFETQIRNLRFDDEGNVFVEKLETTLYDPQHPISKRKVVIHYNTMNMVKIEYPELKTTKIIFLELDENTASPT